MESSFVSDSAGRYSYRNNALPSPGRIPAASYLASLKCIVNPPGIVIERITTRPPLPFSNKSVMFCAHCGLPAVIEILFHDDSSVVVERYCNECSRKILAFHRSQGIDVKESA